MKEKLKAYLSMRKNFHTEEELTKIDDTGRQFAAALGFEPISPLDGVKREEWMWQDCLLDDLRKLSACDAVLVLCTQEEVKESYGIQMEILQAERLGIPVLYASEQSTEIGIVSFWQK